MSRDASSSIIFTGEFRHGIDPKNRVTIPSAWRSGEGADFYLKIDSTGSCIVAFPPEEFRATLAKVDELPGISARERRLFIRQFSAESQACSADKAGRMVLPPDLCAKIGLKGEAMLVGVNRCFEIWNPDGWTDTKTVNTPIYQNVASQLGL